MPPILIPNKFMFNTDHFGYFGAYFFLDDDAYDFNPTLFHTRSYFDISKKVEVLSSKDVFERIPESDLIESTSYKTISGNGKYISSSISSKYLCSDYDIFYVTLMTISKEDRASKGLFDFLKESFDQIGFLNSCTKTKISNSALRNFDEFQSYHMNVEANGKYVPEWRSEDFLSDL
jgi:hypothetical protein